MRSSSLRLHVPMLAVAATILASCTLPEGEGSVASSRAALGGMALRDAEAVMIRVGVLAEDSFYACLLNTLTQGIPLAQAQDDCATKLLEDDGKGFGEDALGAFPGFSDDVLDPAKIVGACNVGDPTTSQSSGYMSFGKYGYASWGEGPGLRGYPKEDSLKLKQEAVDAAKAAWDEFLKLADEELALLNEVKKAQASGDAAEAAKLEEARKAARQAALDAAAKWKKAKEAAKADPNAIPPGTTETAGEGSVCTETMARARELLRECNRTGWKPHACASLQAKMNGCADPALIYVNPEEGYSCGEKADPEAVKNAWVANCERYVKYGPGGDNPCEPPVFEESGRAIRTKLGGVCSNTEAYVDPEQNACVGTLEVDSFGSTSIQEIIFIALEKIGGPIVVLPPPPPPGAPGGPSPEPRP